ncbi:MAG TPA: Gfo/Idh/MocA family oxidoreductase [Firmicutes bacterium]|nr:Gfo/Idh/MocA family oxidoreductase [Bacillota bacterium]
MERVRLAVIGIGAMGQLFSRIFKQMDTVELVAVADVDKNRVEALGKELGVTPYLDYKDILSRPDVDAVAICLPDQLHTEPAIAAARSGKHIFIEKPLALSVEDSQRIIDACNEAKVKLMVGHCLRFDPRFVQAYEAIRRGDIGDVIHARAWRGTSIVNGLRLGGRTSVAFFLGVHDIDILHWYFNSRVTQVYAMGTRKRLVDLGVDDAIFALLKFENGAMASLETSWVMPKTGNQVRSNTLEKGMEIVGTKGMISVEAYNIGIVVQGEQDIYYPDVMYSPNLHGVTTGVYTEELAHFVRCLLHDMDPVTTGRDAMEAVRVAEAIEKSLAEGKPINL